MGCVVLFLVLSVASRLLPTILVVHVQQLVYYTCASSVCEQQCSKQMTSDCDLYTACGFTLTLCR